MVPLGVTEVDFCPVLVVLVLPSEISKIWVVLLGHLPAVWFARPVILRIYVETLRITWVSYWGLNGTLVSAIEDVVPVCVLKEGMGLDTGCATTDITETSRTINGAERTYHIFGFF